MKKFILVSLLLAAFLALFAISNAQEDVLRPKGKKASPTKKDDDAQPRHSKITLGIEPGLNINFFSQDVSWIPNYANTAWDAAKTGTGLSPFLALMIDFPLSNSWGLQVKLITDDKYFSNDKTGTLTDGNPNDQTFGQAFNGEYSYNASFLSENLSLLMRYNFSQTWFVNFGLSFLFPLSDITEHWTQKYQDPTTGQTVLDPNSNNVEITWKQKTRVGIEAGIGVKIPLSNKVWLVPQLRLQIVPTSVLDDHFGYVVDNNDQILYTISYKNIMVHSIQLGLGFWFDLGN